MNIPIVSIITQAARDGLGNVMVLSSLKARSKNRESCFHGPAIVCGLDGECSRDLFPSHICIMCFVRWWRHLTFAHCRVLGTEEMESDLTVLSKGIELRESETLSTFFYVQTKDCDGLNFTKKRLQLFIGQNKRRRFMA